MQGASIKTPSLEAMQELAVYAATPPGLAATCRGPASAKTAAGPQIAEDKENCEEPAAYPHYHFSAC